MLLDNNASTDVPNPETPETETPAPEVPAQNNLSENNTLPDNDDDEDDLEDGDDDTVDSAEFQKLLRQSIRRKNEIKRLQKQLEDSKKSKPTKGAEIDEDAMFERFQQRQAKLAQAEAQRQETLKGLLTEHSLPDEFLSVLADSKNPAETAKKLGQSRKDFKASFGGETEGDTSFASHVAEAFERMGLKE